MARILVVEDCAKTRLLVCRALDARGHETVAARDGHVGLRALERGGFDLVITDIVMPRRDGIEVILASKRLSRAPAIIAIDHPFAGTNAGGRPDYLRMAVDLGADRALAKPIRPRALEEAVEELLGAPALREAV